MPTTNASPWIIMLLAPYPSISDDASFNALQNSQAPIVGYRVRYENAVSGVMHSHPRAQLIRPLTAPTTIRVGSGHYILQPGEAGWLPGGIEHSVTAHQPQLYHSLYVRPDLAAGLSPVSGVLHVSPYLSELIQRLVDLGDSSTASEAYPHLAALILIELKNVRDERQHLPMPTDMRLLRICHSLNESPGDRRTLADWAKLAGASRRMLERGFVEETGMSFSEWRQVCRVRATTPLLEAGHTVQQVSHFAGYDSPSAFAAMFRRVAGVAPAALRGEKLSSREQDPRAESPDTA
ncbi:AraC family transcriptional regulator [Rhizobium sp.]